MELAGFVRLLVVLTVFSYTAENGGLVMAQCLDCVANDYTDSQYCFQEDDEAPECPFDFFIGNFTFELCMDVNETKNEEQPTDSNSTVSKLISCSPCMNITLLPCADCDDNTTNPTCVCGCEPPPPVAQDASSDTPVWQIIVGVVIVVIIVAVIAGVVFFVLKRRRGSSESGLFGGRSNRNQDFPLNDAVATFEGGKMEKRTSAAQSDRSSYPYSPDPTSRRVARDQSELEEVDKLPIAPPPPIEEEAYVVMSGGQPNANQVYDDPSAKNVDPPQPYQPLQYGGEPVEDNIYANTPQRQTALTEPEPVEEPIYGNTNGSQPIIDMKSQNAAGPNDPIEDDIYCNDDNQAVAHGNQAVATDAKEPANPDAAEEPVEDDIYENQRYDQSAAVEDDIYLNQPSNIPAGQPVEDDIYLNDTAAQHAAEPVEEDVYQNY